MKQNKAACSDGIQNNNNENKKNYGTSGHKMGL